MKPKQIPIGKRTRWAVVIVALLCGLCGSSIALPLGTTLLGVRAFKQGDCSTAVKRLNQSAQVLKLFGSLPGPTQADIRLWHDYTLLGSQLGQDCQVVLNAHWTTLADLPTATVVSSIPHYLALSAQIETDSAQSKLLQPLLQKKGIPQRISQATRWLQAVAPLLRKRSTWLVLLQNDNELRATGGFMGSYAVLTLNQGTIENISIEDIYDADGQFTGYFPAPAGVSEYLSSGNGLRLPDANWSPDVPSSIQQVLGYFAIADKQNIDGVITITNSVIAQILTLTGPLPLADYQTSLSADTLDVVLQNRPQPFFPGSIQKKHMLDQAKNQLLFAMSKLSIEDWQKLGQIVAEQLQAKNIAIFSLDPALYQLLSDSNLTGELRPLEPESELFAIVESNVGINKSNRWQERSVALNNNKQQEITAILVLQNRAPNTLEPAESRYTNYLRFITDSNWQLQSVAVDATDVTDMWNQDTITTYAGRELKQVGGLVVVEPGKTVAVELVFNRRKDDENSITLVKQPGLDGTLYQLSSSDNTNSQLLLNHDTLIHL